MSMFLDSEELIELTGYKNKKKQIEALLKNGLKFAINHRFGRPVVSRKELENSLTSTSSNSSASVDVDAMKRLSNG